MDRDLAARYAERYATHWWWRAREAILTGVIEQLSLRPGAEILDVGCGDGLFLPRLGAFGNARGIEVDESLLTPENPYRERIFTAPLGDPAYADWRFDVITALDAIEHMEDDAAAVAQMASMLSPGGWLVVTVPAFMLLWDRHDEINHHYRRYTKRTLCEVLRPHGVIRQLRYLFPGLFLPKLAAKAVGRLRGGGLVQDGLPPAALNSLLTGYCRREHQLLAPLQLPFGTSVLAVLQVAGDGASA